MLPVRGNKRTLSGPANGNGKSIDGTGSRASIKTPAAVMIVPFVFIVALPLPVALVSGVSPGRMAGLTGATLLTEYGAGAVGISLGIP
jgi:hypothetical protein